METGRAKHSHERSDIENIVRNEETNIATNEETQRHKRQKRRKKYSHERKDTDIQRQTVGMETGHAKHSRQRSDTENINT